MSGRADWPVDLEARIDRIWARIIRAEMTLAGIEAERRLACVECGKQPDDDARGWRAYLMAEPVEVAMYCPFCAWEQFDAC